jgi:hypothetical protein
MKKKKRRKKKRRKKKRKTRGRNKAYEIKAIDHIHFG